MMYGCHASASLAIVILHFAAFPLQTVLTITVEISDTGPRLSTNVPTEPNLMRSDGKLQHQGKTKRKDVASSARRPCSVSDGDQCHLVVPGHLALPEMKQEATDGVATPSCVTTYRRAEAVVRSYKALQLERNPSNSDVQADGWVSALEDKIKALVADPDKKDVQVMEQFDHLLGNTEYSDGLAHGQVWTITDANNWVSCNQGRALVNPSGEDALEIHQRIGGFQLEQGDEMLAPDATGSNSLMSTLLEAAVKHRRAVTNTWPQTNGDTAEISYCFSSTISADARTAFVNAVEHLHSQVPCIRLKLTTTSTRASQNRFPDTVQENCEQMPSIIVQSNQVGCWSMVGKISGVGTYTDSSQPINIGSGCEDLGINAHEIGHAIGLLHEMSRADRDEYVEVMKAHISPTMLSNFDNSTAADIASTFDFTSLMMYGSYAFSTDGELTIKPHDLRLVNYMGQRMGFSQLDVELMGTIYGCLATVTPLTLDKQLALDYANGKISTGWAGGPCVDANATGYKGASGQPLTCSNLRKHCAHDTLGEDIRSTCPASCYMCLAGSEAETENIETTAAPTGKTGTNTTKKGNGARSYCLINGLLVAFASLILRGASI